MVMATLCVLEKEKLEIVRGCLLAVKTKTRIAGSRCTSSAVERLHDLFVQSTLLCTLSPVQRDYTICAMHSVLHTFPCDVFLPQQSPGNTHRSHDEGKEPAICPNRACLNGILNQKAQVFLISKLSLLYQKVSPGGSMF